jgi:hypothetical protein
MAGKPLLKSRSIRALTSPHDAVTSSRWRSRQNQFQHKSRRHHAASIPLTPEQAKMQGFDLPKIIESINTGLAAENAALKIQLAEARAAADTIQPAA